MCSFLLVYGSLAGCAKPLPPVENITEAHSKLKHICHDDLGINCSIFQKGETLYLYIPVSFDLIKLKAEKSSALAPQKPVKKRHINFAEAAITNRMIQVQYDITEANSYSKSPGYSSTSSDELSKINNGLLTAIDRSLGDLSAETGVPAFIVVLIVNTENGVGLKNLFYYPDLKKYLQQLLPVDEYVLRYMSEMFGDPRLIKNPAGQGLDLEEITWPEFIARQITYRINFKYTRSSFPPTGEDADEILSIVYDTVQAYQFEDFETIELKDRAGDETFLFHKGQLRTFRRD